MSTRPLRFEPAEPVLAAGYAVDCWLYTGGGDNACFIKCLRCGRGFCVWTDAQGIAKPSSVKRLKAHLRRHEAR